MPHINQVNWFTDQLKRHWDFEHQDAWMALSTTTDTKYQELKDLYYQAFATSTNKERDFEAQERLTLELINMGVLK